MIVLVWPWDVGEDSAFPPWSTTLPEKSDYIAYIDLKPMALMSRSSER